MLLTTPRWYRKKRKLTSWSKRLRNTYSLNIWGEVLNEVDLYNSIINDASVSNWWRIEDDESNITRGSGGNNSKMQTIAGGKVPGGVWSTKNETEGAVIDESGAHKVWTLAAGTRLYFTPPVVAQPLCFIYICKWKDTSNYAGLLSTSTSQSTAMIQHRLNTNAMDDGTKFTMANFAFVRNDGQPSPYPSYGYGVHQFIFDGASSSYRFDAETSSPQYQTGDTGTTGLAAVELYFSFLVNIQMLDFIFLTAVPSASLLKDIRDYAEARYGATYKGYPE